MKDELGYMKTTYIGSNNLISSNVKGTGQRVGRELRL